MSAKDLLRWLCVLPAAAGAYIGSQAIIALVSPALRDSSPLEDYWTQFIGTAISGFCFVYTGARVAPRFRLATAITLAVLHGIFSAVVVTLVVVRSMREGWSLTWLVVTCLVGIAASIGACLRFRPDITWTWPHEN